jgi:hypothetical protein
MVVVLASMLLTPTLTDAEDQPGGQLIIAAGTPGLLVSVTPAGFLTIRFERGIATTRGREITSDVAAKRPALTVNVDPAQVRGRALLRQPVSKAPATSPIGPAGGAGSTAAAPLAVSPAVVGAGGGSVAVSREVAVTIRNVEERRIDRRSEITAPGSAPERRPGGVEVSRPTAGSAGAGATARVIAREEHDAWLTKARGCHVARRENPS